MNLDRNTVWVIPEERGGIRSYSETLLGAFGGETESVWSLETEFPVEPRIIHIQHEFGLFGSKVFHWRKFPDYVNLLRRKHRNAKIVATAHTVIGDDFLYDVRGRGIGRFGREIANRFFRPSLVRAWTEKTWRGLDGVIVHSALQADAIRRSGCESVVVIPHFVPEFSENARIRFTNGLRNRVVVFGYFSHEKGQELAIRAWAVLRSKLGARCPELVLAGGVRRPADRAYFARCKNLIAELELKDLIRITGFVPALDVHRHYADADIVLAPFVETSGSGSLAQALGKGAVVLASDLPLNREISDRTPGSIRLFPASDAPALANGVAELLDAPAGVRAAISERALEYARLFSPSKIVEMHRLFYQTLVGADS